MTSYSGSGTSTRTWALITGSVLTVGAGALGVAYLLKANGADDDANRLRAQTVQDGDQTLVSHKGQCGAGAMPRPAACDALAAAVSDAVTSRNVEIGAFVGAGVFGIATAAVLILWPARRAEHSQYGMALMPWAGPHQRGARLEVQF